MNEETIKVMKEKLEETKYGIVFTNKGVTFSGNLLELLNGLANIVNRLNKEIPKDLIMYAVSEGLDYCGNSKKSEFKDDEFDKILKIVEMLKEL